MGWRYTVDELARILKAVPLGSAEAFTSVSTDSRTVGPGQVFFALKGDQFDGNLFVAAALAKGAVAAVTTQSGEGPRIVVPDPLAALQGFAAEHRKRYEIPVFGLTGSCGKTTTKDLLAAVLATRYQVVRTRGNLNNEIGCPLSLLQIGPDTDFAVIEMGANHRGEIARLCEIARPTESAVTMVAPAHLEGFGSIENVAAAKGEIVEGLPPGGRFYENTDDPWCVRIAERHPGPKTRFGRTGDVVLEQCSFAPDGEMVLDVRPVGRLRLPLLVRAHASNVLLAIAAGLQHGVTEFEEPLREACRRSTRLRRLQIGPMEVLDDTYNANPASMTAALEALAARPGGGLRIAALGAMLELGEAAAALHGQVGEAAARCGVTHLFVRGPHAADMIAGARAGGVPHAEAIDDHAAMAEAICSVAQPGSCLLLKGSRGMKMERVLEALQARYGAPIESAHS